jgi:hypothetical protein
VVAQPPTRALTFGGITEFRYLSSCFSNNAQQGMLTTWDGMPSTSSLLAASIARQTSEPLARRMTSGLPLLVRT